MNPSEPSSVQENKPAASAGKASSASINVAGLASGQRIPVDATQNIDIHRDSAPPVEILPVEGGVYVAWSDGFSVFLVLPEG